LKLLVLYPQVKKQRSLQNGPRPAGRASFARLAGLHEHFRFAARRGRGPAVIDCAHSAHVGGARVFILHYEIARASRVIDPIIPEG
jgi:hypothetical protein